MSKKVLISSLGEAPAVITETIDALLKEDVKIDEVVTISTSDVDIVNRVIPLLQRELREYYSWNISYTPIVIQSDDVNTNESNLTFMEEVCKQIRTYRYRNFDIYISLAGGRKTMSALMCLSAQIYGAKMLLHVIVPPWIEQDGMIDILERKSKDEQKEILHPSQEDVSLVRLPFISLFPMLEEIQEALNSETIQNKEVKEMLLTNGLIEVMEDKCVSTEMGKKLLEILNNIESLPEPSSTSPEKKQVNIKDHDYERKKEDVERFARRLCYCPYVEKVESIKFQPGTKTGIIRVLENGDIDVGYDIRKCRVLLRVYTTAKNKAEGNRVRKELSGFIKYG